MSKEPETYRLELEQILQHFNGKRLLTQLEVAQYLGKSPDYVRNRLKIRKTGISSTGLAMMLSKL